MDKRVIFFEFKLYLEREINMYYKRHMFLCMNRREDQTGCGFLSSEDMIKFAKSYLQSQDQWGEGKIRVSKSGCLGGCDYGPTCVVYPEGTWYSYVDEFDIKKIIDKHLINGEIVEELLIKKD